MDLINKPTLYSPRGVRVLWGWLGTLAVLSLCLWLLPLLLPELWAYRLPSWLSLRPTLVGFFSQPWGIVTYCLVHQSLIHLLGNMALHYYAGRAFLGLYSWKVYAGVLVVASLVGGGLYVLAYQLFSALGFLIVPYGLVGASASAYALLFAVALSQSQQVVAIVGYRMSMLNFALGLLALNTLLSLGNFGGHMSHLGGVLVGLLGAMYMKWRATVMATETLRPSISQAEFDQALKGVRASGFYSLSDEERQALLGQKDGKDE